MNGQPAVNARDRIGAGPWTNAAGVAIAVGMFAAWRISQGLLNELGGEPAYAVQIVGSIAAGNLAVGIGLLALAHWLWPPVLHLQTYERIPARAALVVAQVRLP